MHLYSKSAYAHFSHKKVWHWMGGWMYGWEDGWVDGWMGGKARLRIAYSNQKEE